MKIIQIIKKNKTLLLVGVVVIALLVMAYVVNNTKSIIRSKAETTAEVKVIKLSDVVKVTDENGNPVICTPDTGGGDSYTCETSGNKLTIGLADALKN